MKQVICNLIDNAIKYTQEGEITVATEIDDKRNQVIVQACPITSLWQYYCTIKFWFYVTKHEGLTILSAHA
ncbi:MAG: hypothetical protein ACRD8W_22810 [Nitrososphaeraceae archaeon]